MENRFAAIVKEKKDEELLEMVYQFKEWDPVMLQAVEDELTARNILPEDVKERKEAIIAEEENKLAEGKQATVGGQILGWLGIFGLLGLAIGYNYAFSKTRSPYSNKVYYTFNKDSREVGNYIFYIGIAAIVLSFFYFAGRAL